jgi:hypothetical protein
MDVKIPLTKLVLAFIVLLNLSDGKGNHAGQSAFFARQKWTLEDAYQFVWGLIGLVFVYKVLVPLWFPCDTPETPYWGQPSIPPPLRGARRFKKARPLHNPGKQQR